MALVAVLPATALAHAHLASASPAGNATVAAPETVTLGFTEPLEKNFSSVEVRDSHGARVDQGRLLTTADPASLAAGVPKLPPGRYQVIWHATSVDTRRTNGSFTFTVVP
jgi:methionine-rich copper-binding protein CopC